MDELSRKKIIQAMLSFLEAVHGKKDKEAISDLIMEMLDFILEFEPGADQTGNDEIPAKWNRLDHDLRSPMNGILGFTNILLEECNDPDAKWKLEQISNSAEKLMQIFIKNRIYGYSCQSLTDQAETPQKPVETKYMPEVIFKPLKTKTRAPKIRLPNVLIVEDNSVNSNLLMMHLKKRCHLFFSVSGKAAIEVARNEKIDAIFMDINLGEGMDGTQAMKEIRMQVGNEHLPVIAVTGFAGREDREFFLQAGFNDFIPKPFQRKDVIEVFERLFPQ